jgi:hypothetical protein
MGGYFGVYVLMMIGVLTLAARAAERRTRWIVFGFMAVATVTTAIQPAAHDLRYYMVYMLCLVIVALHLVYVAGDETLRRMSLLIVASCFAATNLLSGGRWLAPGPSAAEVVLGMHIRQNIDGVRDGSTICIESMQVAFLYAEIFHPGRAYLAIETPLWQKQEVEPRCDVVFK